MNLTLFPVAAFLLLLSGIGAPAHTAGQAETSAALMRVLFGGWDGAHTSARMASFAATGAGQRANAATRPMHALPCGSQPFAKEGIAPQPEQAIPSGFDRKRYRTRFGFADGAYLAVGPPRAGLRHGPGAQRV